MLVVKNMKKIGDYRGSSVNAHAFDAAKKIQRAKVIKRRFVKAIIPAAAAIAVTFSLAMPYVNSSNTIDEFVEVNNNDIAYVENNSDDISDMEEEKKEDSIPWGTVPEGLSFEGDIVGYLSDVGDVLNNVYPITQSKLDDPNFYINHDVYGNYSEFGNLYKDSLNHRGLVDDVSIIYGHNLIDGSMFGELSNYLDKESYLGNRSGQDFYNEQKEVYGDDANCFIYTDEYGQYRLDIAAAGVYDGKEVLSFAGNFDNENDKKHAIDYINSGSDISSDIVLDENSKIVVLQTCEDMDSSTYYKNNEANKDYRAYIVCKVTQLVKFKDYDEQVERGKGLS